MKCKYHHRSILFVLILAIAVITIVSVPLSAQAQNRTVKVGLFELNGFFRDRGDGTPVGYGADYLEKVSDLTGWSYEYVWAQNWDECLRLLKEGQVDLIAPAQKTEERMVEFAFSSFSMGIEYGALLALDTNDRLIYEDFQSFNQMKTGYVESIVFKDSFYQYAERNNFQPRMIPYRDTKSLMAALNAGYVDAALVNLFTKTDTTKVLAQFGASPFFFMLNKNNTSLLLELDEALLRLKTEIPDFDTQLTGRYYPFIRDVPFTKAELDYIKAAPVLTVGYRPDMIPLSYADKDTGEFSGVTRELLDQISSISGLKFQYVELPLGTIDYSYLTENHISLISSVEYNSENAGSAGLRLTIPYLDSKKVFICRQDQDFSTDSHLNLAVATGSKTLSHVIKSAYPNFNVIVYDSMKDCFEAVKNKEADALLQNQYVVTYYLSNPRYNDMKTIPAETLLDQMCLSPIANTQEHTPDSLLSDERLISILDKSISRIPEQETARIIIRETAENSYSYSYGDFLYQYRYSLFAMAVTLCILIGILCYTVLLRRRSMALIKNNEAMLRNIAANINGGVVVLAAWGELRIVYANDGFLELLQLGKDDLPLVRDQLYTAYVHPEDIPSLNSIADKNAGTDNRISFKIRILRQDKSYIPVLFNGTLSENESGERLIYCVIMDITVQEQLIKTISLEQKKYDILMKSSGNIIFEVDCTDLRLTVSPLFNQKFGWNLSDTVPLGSLPDYLYLLRINEDDIKPIKTITQQMMEHKDSVEAEVRIMKYDGRFTWCRIFQYPMLNAEGELVTIIGKILDIHDEVLEKERLERQSRLDPLTGLLNKGAFFAEAGSYLKTEEKNNTSLVFIDLDNFKQINDRLGHMAGDTAIKDTARKLQVIFSNYDILARFGGDEFCILLKEIPMETLKDKLAWTVEKLKAVYSAGSTEVHISASIGAVCTHDLNENLELLLEQADKALYRAKEQGKDQFVIYYDGMQE